MTTNFKRIQWEKDLPSIIGMGRSAYLYELGKKERLSEALGQPLRYVIYGDGKRERETCFGENFEYSTSLETWCKNSMMIEPTEELIKAAPELKSDRYIRFQERPDGEIVAFTGKLLVKYPVKRVTDWKPTDYDWMNATRFSVYCDWAKNLRKVAEALKDVPIRRVTFENLPGVDGYKVSFDQYQTILPAANRAIPPHKFTIEKKYFDLITGVTGLYEVDRVEIYRDFVLFVRLEQGWDQTERKNWLKLPLYNSTRIARAESAAPFAVLVDD